jgi:predicted ribonuclease YlaK
LPNTEADKLAVHFSSVRLILEQFLGKGKVESDLDQRIFFKAPNFMLGSTLDNSLILIDEVQQLQPIILKLILERVGKNSKVVVAGCSSQIYTTDKTRNALADAKNRFFTMTDEWAEAKYPDMAYHEFSIDECHRSDIVKSVIHAYRGE